VVTVNSRRLAVLAIVFCWAHWVSTAHADWATCRSKPTRNCLVEEALHGDAAPLAGKDRLDVLIQADAYNHVEYATSADIEEAQRQATPTPVGYGYAILAIRGLVAANHTQRAADLVASFHGPIQSVAFLELTRTLAKAGDVDTAAALLDRIGPALDATTRGYLGQTRVVETVKALAEVGKIEDALPLVISARGFPEVDVAQMQMTVAQAYAKRGNTKTAQSLFNVAGQTLEEGRRYAFGSAADAFQAASISLSALRGDVEAVRAGLQQLQSPPAENPAMDRIAANNRGQYYQRIVYSLLQTKQFPLALEVAKSAPDSIRDATLALVNSISAANGRIGEARTALALLGDNVAPKVRAVAVRNIAVAMAKAGNLIPAVEMAEQVTDPTCRKGALFAIAQTLPN